jgi:hypothetical protein
MITIYRKHGYHAYIDRSSTVVVYRESQATPLNCRMVAHVGEKHTSQDWREVTLYGCPIEIKREIAKAHLTAVQEMLP